MNAQAEIDLGIDSHPPLNGYVCFYNGQRYEVYAPDLYQAKVRAIHHFKAPKKKEHMISVVLCELAGRQVTTTLDY